MATTYPCEPLEGVQAQFVPHILIGAMACRYCRAVGPEMDISEGMDAAMATWETEWDSDPAPRTYAAAMEEVDNDLQYWTED